MKEALTKETVIRTNFATIVSVVIAIIAVTGGWTTLMLRVGSVESGNLRQDEKLAELDAKIEFNRETFLTIEGDLKEIKARLPQQQ